MHVDIFVGIWICFLIISPSRKNKKSEHTGSDLANHKVDTEAVCHATIVKNETRTGDKTVRVRQVSLIGRRYKDTCREVQEWKKRQSNSLEDRTMCQQKDEVFESGNKFEDDFQNIDILNNNDIINNNMKQTDVQIYNPPDIMNEECIDCVPEKWQHSEQQ